MIALASSSLGKNVGSYTTGVFYLVYTLVAMLLSNLIVGITGFKWGIFFGLFVYCGYVASFLVHVYASSVSTSAAIVGSVVGGIAAGFLWTAQGGYFAQVCDLYAVATKQERPAVTGWLGGVFAALYLGCEVGMKALSSALEQYGDSTVYIAFTVIAVGSALVSAFIEDLTPYTDPAKVKALRQKSILEKIKAAFELLVTDRKMLLLWPAQLTFGFAAVFLNSYSNSHIIKTVLGHGNKKYVGYMSAIVAGSAALLTLPFGAITKRVSKVYLMVLGGVIFTAECAVFFALTDEQIGVWAIAVPLYVAHGIGRCVWEGTNKAVIADFFPASAPAAFANVVMANGVSSGIGFLILPKMHRNDFLVICLSVAVLSIFTSVLAFAIWWREAQVAKTTNVVMGSRTRV